MVVRIPAHGLTKSLNNFSPKYDTEICAHLENHIKLFIIVVRVMKVKYEYVVFRLFPYTFEGKESTCYFILQQASITNWV